MYYPVQDQELHPDNYTLAEVSGSVLEDEVHDLLSKPRQTQLTVGLYLKKKKDAEKVEAGCPTPSDRDDKSLKYQNRPDPNQLDPYLEKTLIENKGFWVDKPTLTAPLIYKLKELYSVELPRKDRKGKGIFARPAYLELDHLIKLGKEGLLYPDEEISDSDEEVKPDETMCLPLRKKKYKICDPCKVKPDKKDTPTEAVVAQPTAPFKKIPTGCQCNYYGEHNTPPTVWDYPYKDEVDMIRQHEMNKYLKPFKSELLNRNYKKNPPVFFTPILPEAKRTYPDLMLSNL